MALTNALVDLANTSRTMKLRAHKFVSRRGYGTRVPSFPFISGDTFRALSGIVLDEQTNPEDIFEALVRKEFPENVLFCELGREQDLLGLSERIDLNHVNVVIHNGDVLAVGIIEELSLRVGSIYCVNWLGSRTVAEPIPIGLENAHWNINGRLDDLIQYYPSNLRASISRIRPTSCFQSFKTATNVAEREGVSAIFKDIKRSQTYNSRISRSAFMKHLNSSRFVISPPGNGPDCHRTWEAMYAGAVPVVLKRAWPFGHLALPALVVDSWMDARDLLSGDTNQLYEQIWANADEELLYFPAYQRLIWES